MATQDKSTFSRRNFLKGGIIVGAGALGAIALSGCSDPNATATIEGEETPAAGPSQAVKMYRGYYAGHGDRCFTQAVFAVDEEDKIVALNIDDYQFIDKTTEDITPLPNATMGLSAGNIETMWLCSKRANDTYYSEHMAESGEATQGWIESMTAVQEFAVGKTTSELTSVELDAVSGSTLEDTPSYLAGLDEVFKAAQHVSEGTFEADGELELGLVNVAAHGINSFANAAALVQGETFVCASIDEFQYMDAATTGVTGVPNSDKTFGVDNYVAGRVLGSKAVNTESYGANMKERGDATQDWLTSIEGIEGAFAGKKISELKMADFEVDTISGSTLSDSTNYAKAALDAAVEAWWQ